MKHFKFYTKEDILSITKTRRFETKIGERVCTLDKQGEWPQVLTNSKAKYVIVGIPG
jgi:formiminoglutamase